MKKITITGLIVVAAVLAGVIFAGCMEKSAYRVEYSLLGSDKLKPFEAPMLLVNVSGPANDLAIILTNPQGYQKVTRISKEALIDNFESVVVSLYEEGSLSPTGDYKLVIKTITPEKVVYKTEMKFKPADIQIIDANVAGRTWLGYYALDKFNIVVKNNGELPLLIDKVIITANGKKYSLSSLGVSGEGLYAHHGKSEIGGWISSNEPGTSYKPGRGSPPSSATVDIYSGEKKIASSTASVTIRKV